MAKLVVHRPDGTVRDIKLDRDRITIGRRADNDLCLPYPAVSAEHAEVVTVVGDSFLHDCGSTNGTLVNGARISKHFLRDHDRIDIGRVQLVYLVNEAEVVEPTAAGGVREGPAESREAASGVDSSATGGYESSPLLAMEARKSSTAPIDDLLADILQTTAPASMAVDLPPTISIVRPERATQNDATSEAAQSGALIQVLSGPNAGQTSPLRKKEFVLGKGANTVAVIRRDDAGYLLVSANGNAPLLNGRAVEPEGARLAFGDIIQVAGVNLRFERGPE